MANRQEIYLIDKSGQLTDSFMQDVREALQIQFDEHYSPVWGEYATFFVAKDESEIKAGAWAVYSQNTIDVVGAVGYHWVDDKNTPVAFVSVDGNDNVDITFSHESLEMRRNPYLNKIAKAKKIDGIDGENVDYLVEVADVTYSDYGYEITVSSGRKVKVSDFYYPEFFFGTGLSSTAKYSHTGIVKAPRTLVDGGILSFTDVRGEVYQAVNAKGRVTINKVANSIGVSSNAIQYTLIILGGVIVIWGVWRMFRKTKKGNE